MGTELEKPGSLAKIIIWLNPMLGRDGFEPDAPFMQFAAPHIARLAPAHSLSALKDSIRYLANA